MKNSFRCILGILAILSLSAFTSGGSSGTKSNSASKRSVVKGANQKDIRLVTIPPANPEKQEGVCILLPPGPGNRQMVQDVERNLGKEFAKRNWEVLIPESPNGQSFFGKNTEHIAALLSSLEEKQVILAGVSNGGISAIEVASAHPQKIKALVIVPGVLRNSRVNTRGLRGKPMFLRIGERDELKWGQAYEGTVKALRSSGVQLDAKLMPKTGHVFRVNWKELGPWLEQLPDSSAASAGNHSAPQSKLPGFRTWTDNDGRQIYAKALMLQGDAVILLKDNQRQYRFPLEKLSAEDQAYIKEELGYTPAPTPKPSNSSKPNFQGLSPSRSDIPGPPKINYR